MSLVRALRDRLRDDQSGFTLIEVLVSAAMLVLVSVGVLKTLDAAANRSGEQKSQAIAAALAQQDQERLRAYRAQELNNYTETRCLGRGSGGALVKDPECDDPGHYKVVSRTDWVSDSSGTRACGSGARADYIRISSTVIWVAPDDAETGAHRVSLASIVAPRVGSFGDEGSLSIELLDRDGVGREGVPVTVSGPKSLSGTTDKNGCLFFGYLPEGNYTVEVTQPPLIDVEGNTNVSKPFGVNDGSVTSAVIELDEAAGINVSFSTRKGSGAPVVASHSEAVTIGHSGLPAPGTKTYGNDSTLQANYLIGSLFPFTSSYVVYSGNCPGANPQNYGITNPNPFAPPSGGLTPGGTTPITVREPALRVRRGSNNLPSNTRVRISWAPNYIPGRNGGGPTYCAGTKTYRTDGSSWIRIDGTTAPNAPGDPGIAYGTYNICAEYLGKRLLLNGFELNNPDGETATLPTSGTVNAPCP